MRKRSFSTTIWFIVILLMMNSGFLESLFDGGSKVSYDHQMATTAYHTDITVGEDDSYLIDEKLQVDFQTGRHGIYRYIPMKDSSIYEDEDGNIHKVPYYADVEVQGASTEVEVYEESGNTVIRMGSEYDTVYGPTSYRLKYLVTPKMQDETYSNAYYNIFPQLWQNDIPAGSSFSITFPRDFDHGRLHFYTGEYGEVTDAASILELSWEGNTLNGTLTKKLPFQTGLTFFAGMEPGYFTQIHTMSGVGTGLWILALVVLGVVVLLFFLFGKDEKIYPSIQYQPPDDLDSAAVGYIIDGGVEDRDVLSLIIYWADKGYLRIREAKKKNMLLEKLKDLPDSAPSYEHTMFRKLFGKGDEVSVESLKYKFADTLHAVKDQIKALYSGRHKGGIYTSSSKVARVISTILCILPFGAFVLAISIVSPMTTLRGIMHVVTVIGLLVGVCVFDFAVDNWYSKDKGDRTTLVAAGLGVSIASVAVFAGSYLMRVKEGEVFSFLIPFFVVAAATAVMVLLTAFMKKRTHQCAEWMGRLIGLRDFIETAELERLKALAEDNPEWFYHVLPYTYVFGLSDIFAKKLEGLAIPGPDWYMPMDRGDTFWDYYIFHHMFMSNMNYAARTMTQIEPPKVTNSGSHPGGFGGNGGSFGGGFGGGGSFGGGGFSGGGFGGGGGGSW
ncbi:MAG: DUF2207 domain-containing protein [Blautia sp.]|jgi:hypothetical protein